LAQRASPDIPQDILRRSNHSGREPEEFRRPRRRIEAEAYGADLDKTAIPQQRTQKIGPPRAVPRLADPLGTPGGGPVVAPARNARQRASNRQGTAVRRLPTWVAPGKSRASAGQGSSPNPIRTERPRTDPPRTRRRVHGLPHVYTAWPPTSPGCAEVAHAAGVRDSLVDQACGRRTWVPKDPSPHRRALSQGADAAMLTYEAQDRGNR